MASIAEVRTGWRATRRTPDGRSRSKTFARKSEAQKHLASIEHAKLTGGYVDPTAGKVKPFRCSGHVNARRSPVTTVSREPGVERKP